MQSLLRELFQLDCKDFEFGIYRVLEFKRREIEEFLPSRIVQHVRAAGQPLRQGRGHRAEVRAADVCAFVNMTLMP
ncbi:MAG: hypothetical protein RMH97_00245 [Verrucomicrobiales bacterium]|nr:hypothetical protein [Verrucomicrobiales bacterium]